MPKVSLYFYAGNFAEAVRRFDNKEQQNYQTHDEVVRLLYELRALDFTVDVYSFVTPTKSQSSPIEGVRVFSLGAKSYRDGHLLKAAVEQDRSAAIVAHFAHLQMLKAVIRTSARSIAVLANSYNRVSVRELYRKWQVVSVLNNPKFDLVSNHCLPATNHLAEMGVAKHKLIAWDVARTFSPTDIEPKTASGRTPAEIFYAGAIIEDKGVGDVIRAVAKLAGEGLPVRATLAGGGDVDAMKALAASLGVADSVVFAGMISNGEVRKQMRAVDLVLIPSRRPYTEGFPLTMFEAIASRTPIVCSDHPMFRPVMIDGKTASVFHSGDAAGCAAAMRRLLTDPALYATLSRNADVSWQSLQGPADWRTMIRKWVVEGRDSPWLNQHKLIPA
jgi:glycosyltransferase involved in cell wall biosynthesis